MYTVVSFITDFGGCCLQNISKLGHPRSLRLLVVCPSGPAVAAAAFFNSGFAPSFSFSNATRLGRGNMNEDAELSQIIAQLVRRLKGTHLHAQMEREARVSMLA